MYAHENDVEIVVHQEGGEGGHHRPEEACVAVDVLISQLNGMS